MKEFLVALLFIALATPLAQDQIGRPVPRGVRDGEEAEQAAERSIPPPNPQPMRVNPARVRQQASELADLSRTVPLEVESSLHGVLPKDLNQKLKKIEKLSKQLRSEISR
jgi:hypothetical protein